MAKPYKIFVKIPRICKKCGIRYTPTGKYQRICQPCNVKSRWDRPKKW